MDHFVGIPISPNSFLCPLNSSLLVACDYGQVFESQERDTMHQYMIDAGVIMNSPYPLLLRPQRAVDIILSFDFSAREKENEELFEVSHPKYISVLLSTAITSREIFIKDGPLSPFLAQLTSCAITSYPSGCGCRRCRCCCCCHCQRCGQVNM